MKKNHPSKKRMRNKYAMLSCGGRNISSWIQFLFSLSRKSFIWPFHFRTVLSSVCDNVSSLLSSYFFQISKLNHDNGRKSYHWDEERNVQKWKCICIEQIYTMTSEKMILFVVAQFIFYYRRKCLILFSDEYYVCISDWECEYEWMSRWMKIGRRGDVDPIHRHNSTFNLLCVLRI